ncbi:MAG: hypothetical protein H7061_00625 [Bdellovibrionaceae bacterium]|nr:hypothetical protein [Bdellovibrio sp.]
MIKKIDYKSVLLTEVVQLLDQEKITKTIVNSNGTMLKKAPSFNSKNKQQKAIDIYNNASAEYDLQKPQLQKKMLEKIREDLNKAFTKDELKYLSTLLKYPPYIKLRQLMSSQDFEKSYEIPFNEAFKLKKNADAKISVLKD